MLKFNFSGKDLGLVSQPHSLLIFQENCFTCYVLLTDQISLSESLYFSRYWGVLQLFVN